MNIKNIWNEVKFGLVKIALWKLLLIPLVICSMSSFTFFGPDPIEISDQAQMIWVSEWISSDNMPASYGKGRFFYRLSRSQYTIDKSGNYQYEIYFLSDSYYTSQNYNGITPYRCATKIDQVTLYVNGQTYLNNMTRSTTFWVLFQGDYVNGIGERRVSLTHPSANAIIYIQWSQPYPY